MKCNLETAENKTKKQKFDIFKGTSVSFSKSNSVPSQ